MREEDEDDDDEEEEESDWVGLRVYVSKCKEDSCRTRFDALDINHSYYANLLYCKKGSCVVNDIILYSLSNDGTEN